MFDFLHDAHFVLNLLVQDAVLHELPLVEFFGRIRFTTEPRGHLVDGSEGASAHLAHTVVLLRPTPRLWKTIKDIIGILLI